MRKLILLILFSLILVSCTKKEKTYEALEAEVLCDVLPEVILPLIQIDLPPPPPSSSDSLKIDLNNNSIVKDIEKQRAEIKKLIQQKHKVQIDLNSLMFSLKKTELKTDNQNIISNDSLMERKFQQNELSNSTLKINFLENFEYDSLKICDIPVALFAKFSCAFL